ncbi:MAG: exodeoxyribonuclease VII large subunit [Pirellulaceae bacterium]|jgi:exodeoxyribonuclease VII large subunit
MEYGYNHQQDDPPERVLSVSQLTAIIKQALEETFPMVWVGGEVSDVARPRSGHIYLTLKDESAQIRAVIWRTTAQKLDFEIEDGMEVICLGAMDVYPPRGGYQLVLRKVEPLGQGAMQMALKQLQKQLAAEGLFDPAHKQPLPKIPRLIAVVTSPSGAAIRDFLEVLRRRWKGVDVIVIPTRVQGEGASTQIARGIRAANRLRPAPDVIVVTRGGGSMEDLWCFNEEAVVRAIFMSKIPTVSAVGHEIDVTLSDLVADVRALTPTEAAERIVPHQDEVVQTLDSFRQRLVASLRNLASRSRNQVDSLANRRVLRAPLERIRELSQYLDDLQQRANRAIVQQHQTAHQKLAVSAGKLESLSPLAILGRGYSVTQNETGEVVRSTESLREGDRIVTTTAAGRISSRVEELHQEEIDPKNTDKHTS